MPSIFALGNSPSRKVPSLIGGESPVAKSRRRCESFACRNFPFDSSQRAH
jgi:hypothetical protein